MSLATICNWGANFLVAQTFLTLSSRITRAGVFFLYAGLAVLAWLFFLRKVPETKGKSLEEIQSELGGDQEALIGAGRQVMRPVASPAASRRREDT